MAVRFQAACPALRLLVLILCLSIGCKEADPGLAPVRGKITQVGRPVVEARIVLHPQQMQPAGLPKPQAITDASGEFEVTTLTHNDGALPGQYVITVELRDVARAGEEMIRNGRHLLPPRYASPTTSELARAVQPGENNWEPIDLKAK